MTDHETERAEQALRTALAYRAADAPQEPLSVPGGGRRRTWWIAGAAAAAVIVAASVPVLLLGGDDDPVRPDPAASDAVEPDAGMRWVGYRDVEVQVPEDWGFDDSPSLPACVRSARDESANGVPHRAYVEIDTGYRAVAGVDCTPPERPADMPAEFGDLIFELWQSHVTLADRGDDSPNGRWTYRGWTLTRATIEGVQVSVLGSPEEEGLGDQVVDSARVVGADVNRCSTTSPVQAAKFRAPKAGPVPDPGWSGLVAVCQYVRGEPDTPGLIGSRMITGREAERLVEAIHAAPAGGGPDRPQNCVDDQYGEQALVLSFLPRNWTRADIAYPEAYAYYDWCFGNGIVDSEGIRQLTEDNCKPLFSEPPVTMWSAQNNVWDHCWSRH